MTTYTGNVNGQEIELRKTTPPLTGVAPAYPPETVQSRHRPPPTALIHPLQASAQGEHSRQCYCEEPAVSRASLFLFYHRTTRVTLQALDSSEDHYRRLAFTMIH